MESNAAEKLTGEELEHDDFVDEALEDVDLDAELGLEEAARLRAQIAEGIAYFDAGGEGIPMEAVLEEMKQILRG